MALVLRKGIWRYGDQCGQSGPEDFMPRVGSGLDTGEGEGQSTVKTVLHTAPPPLQMPAPLHCSLFYSLGSPKPSQTSIQADAFSYSS